MSLKLRSITVLVIAEILGMSLWFTSSAVLTDMLSEADISRLRQALLASGVQVGFAIGAIGYAIAGMADRYDPRRVFAISAIAAALANGALLALPIGSGPAILTRMITGAMLAGVYPVGMKIAVGWGTKDRGLLVGLLVGALTLGSAAPHLLAFMGGSNWRLSVGVASILAIIGGLMVLLCTLGPHHARAPRLDLSSLKLAWTDRHIRYAYAGYLGHMWELYAFWAWIAIALNISFTQTLPAAAALSMSKLVAFLAVGVGAIACVIAGLAADRIGKAQVTIWAMGISGTAALACAFLFSAPPLILSIAVLIWGASIIADSAQFSALVADFAPPQSAGALLTLQTALGFALTVMTVQVTPFVAASLGWPGLFAILAIGPGLGIIAMLRLLADTTKTPTNKSEGSL